MISFDASLIVSVALHSPWYAVGISQELVMVFHHILHDGSNSSYIQSACTDEAVMIRNSADKLRIIFLIMNF
jgi:hypothetical protein